MFRPSGGRLARSTPMMRLVTAALALTTLVVCASPTVRGQQALLDTPVPSLRAAALKENAPCDLWRTVEHVSRFARVPVGFEHTASCAPQGWGRRPEADAVVLDGLTPRQMFDRLVEARPDYAWRVIDDVVVMRPVAAWQDAGNVLARAVAPLSVTGRRPHDLLHDVYQSARPSLFQPHQDLRRLPFSEPPAAIDSPVDLAFPGGPLLQALNVVATRSGARWELGYWGHPQVTLYATTYDGGAASVPMRIPR